MSNINALIAAGPHTQGLNMPGIMQGVQDLRQSESRNKLLDMAVDRAPIIQQRQDDEYLHKLKIQTAGEYSALYEAEDYDGALRVFVETAKKMPQTPESQAQLQPIMAALASPDPADNRMVADNLYKNAKPLSMMGQENEREANAQFGTSRPVIAVTASGKKINGIMADIRDPDSGVVRSEFIPDVPGSFDPSDAIVSTDNVGRTGITGEDQNEATRRRMLELEEFRTEQLALRDKEKSQNTRLTNFADTGLSSAEAYTTTKRSIDLLRDIETGGWEGVALKAKQLFGIQAADEAELTTGMLRGVLAQLRPIFGAAFTATEGNSLKEIEANIGKSTAGNRRLLSQLLRIQERSAKRGAAAARKIGDDFTADEIEAQLQFDLSEEPPQGGAKEPPSQIPEGFLIENDAGERMIYRNGNWEPYSG